MTSVIMNVIKTLIERINKSDIAKRMATGAFWQVFGTAMAKLIVLVSGILCARILGQTEYGQFNMVRSTINMFVIFGTAGMGLTATKYISEYRKGSPERIGSIYILTNRFALFSGCIISTLIFFLAPMLSTKTLDAPELVLPIRVGALLLFMTIINGAQQGTLSGFEDFRSIAINTLIGSIAESIGLLIGGYYFGVAGAVLGYGVGFIVLYLSNYIAIKKRIRESGLSVEQFTFNKKDLQLLYKFSLPAALSSIMVAPVFWLIRTMLVNYSDFAELAIYEAADQWKAMILFVPAAVSQVVLPILSGMVNDDTDRYKKVLRYNVALNATVASLLALGVIIFSKIIMRMYGADYVDVWPIILLSLSTIPTSIATVVGLSISSRAKMWIGFLFNLLWGLMVALFAYMFLRRGLGATGLGLAILCAYCIHATLQTIYLKNLLRNTMRK